MLKPDSVFGPIISSVMSSAPAGAGSVEAAFSQVILANATTQAPSSRAMAAIDAWELAEQRALGRYRNWLTHNMILFLVDVLNSPQGGAGLERIKGGFGQNVAEQALGNLASMAAVKIGPEPGTKLIAKWLLEKGTARVLGGIVAFVVGAIVEAVFGDLLDKTDQIVDYTADQIDTLVTAGVNPVVNANQEAVTKAIQELRADFMTANLSVPEWQIIQIDATLALSQVSVVVLDEDDEYLYRQMALRAEVYSRHEVPAETTPPIAPAGTGHDIGFRMQQALVKTEQTSIDVAEDGSTLILRLRGYDCIVDEDGFGPVDINAPDTPSHWKHPWPAREYAVQLYQKGTVVDSDVGVDRIFQVGQEEYGIWYNLPKGVYHVSVGRSSPHPVALCGDGKYWVQKGS
jgi:hypothetical protein